ncbi:MAG TPA: transcription termination factor Rho [Dehalococcoidia bacterium]|nr:transcription termination factor Rho [Dehalococcoidia bacterium]
MSIAELESRTREELLEEARSLGLSGVSGLRKQDLILRILQARAQREGNYFAGGILEITSEGYGFLRTNGYKPSPSDVYVSQSQIRRFGLRTGDYVMGQVRPPKESEKYYGLLRVEATNGMDPEVAKGRPTFEQLTPTFPDRFLQLERGDPNATCRLIDLVAPVGRGQRGLVVSPPKGGKTMLLKSIARAVLNGYEDIQVMVLLIGERPEEVTDWRKSVEGDGAEVVAATFDDPEEVQTRVAELAVERAKRLVEMGRHVMIMLDGITRLTRAYNLCLPPSGRTLSGGIDPVALHPPKKLFGTARNTEEGGSLTIIATCLIDTGSRMDEVIFEEFKGTGNWELWLDRRLAEKRIFPAVDIFKSGTRREELMLDEKTYQRLTLFRRALARMAEDFQAEAPYAQDASIRVTERLLEQLRRTKSNEQLLSQIELVA